MPHEIMNKPEYVAFFPNWFWGIFGVVQMLTKEPFPESQPTFSQLRDRENSSGDISGLHDIRNRRFCGSKLWKIWSGLIPIPNSPV